MRPGAITGPLWSHGRVNRGTARSRAGTALLVAAIVGVALNQRPAVVALAQERGLTLRGFSPARYYADFYGQWDDGETHLEQVSVEMLIAMLDAEVGPGVTEFGCHPGYAGGGFSSSYLVEREAELRTLCDPAVRAHIDARGIVLIGFAELPEIAAGPAG